jgi:ABC-type sugar transport system ATPase subunit
VLRDGRVVAHLEDAGDVETVIHHMIGKSLEIGYPRRREVQPDVVLSVRNLSSSHLRDVSLEVRRGEVVCLAGLVGSGRTEILRAIYGADPLTGGTIELAGATYTPHGPRRSIARGMGLVPEDRKQQGLVLPLSVSSNVALGNESWLSRLGLISASRESDMVDRSMKDLRVKAPSARTAVDNLSGGNQQKVVLGRWLVRDVDLLLIDEPTVGIDVGARAEFYKLLDDFAAAGGACLVVSSDLTEVLGLADRVVVIRSGSSVATLTGERMNREDVLLAMTVGAA